MGFQETILIYFVIGLVVAAANSLVSANGRLVGRVLSFAVTVPFWPLLAPFLLSRPRAPGNDSSLEGRIAAGEARLLATLKTLDGIAEEVLMPEVERVRGLGQALRTMARRSIEM